jgi:diguanylate cyclase (GGDEF)-like protein
MTDSSEPAGDEAVATPGAAEIYARYGQLIKMLLPRCGVIAFYGADEELLWCSDGCERPDLKVILEDLPDGESDELTGCGAIRGFGDDDKAFVYVLRNQAAEHLGTVVVELADGGGRQTSGSMVASLLRPVLDCLEDRVEVESTRSAPVPSAGLDETQTLQLKMLIGGDATTTGYRGGLEAMIRQCVGQMDCVVGALLIPDRNTTISATAGDGEGIVGTQALSKTHKHLLAWIQLHNKPMVINRVMADAADKNVPPYKILSCPVHDANGRVIGLLGLFRAAGAKDFQPSDVVLVELMSRKAMDLLTNCYDALTGLMNRYAFEHEAQSVLDRADVNDSSALLYIDIDGLNVVNETFGFHAGDEVIQRLAVVIKSHTSSDDLIGRLGGDRFVVMIPRDASSSANELAENLCTEMGQLAYLHGDRAIPVSVSVGVDRSTGPREVIAHVIAAAEYACKRAKKLGRNRVEVSHGDNAFSVPHRADALAFASLQTALKANRFSVEIQSIQRLSDDVMLGNEVLMRMHDGDGLVGPEKFLAAARRYHLMPALDRWVLAAALRSLTGPGQLLFEQGFVALNVSAQSYKSDSFRETLIEQLGSSGLPLASICVELRESSAAHHMREAEALIHALRELGVKVALDDFGRGLSSLAYLRSLPVQYIKIDGELVRRVGGDKLAASMVGAIAQAAATLEIATIAEHVESEALKDKLLELGVDYGQGFFYSQPKPMPTSFDDLAEPKRSVS